MKTFGKIISLLMLPLIAEIIYGALMSYFYKAPPIWGFETTIFLYGSFFMLGSGYCHLEKKHVAVDVIIHHVKPKTARALSIFAEIVVLFVVIVMLYMSAQSAYKSIMIRERSMHQTPFNPEIWWYKCVIPISCALVSWQAFKDIRGLITGKGLAKDRQKKEGANNAA
ncbi:MAG: TRAP transporter small permease [Synergistaceae bacterium]|nr:TRAP transporter small permease [Synergistaceae bacterium]